MNWLRLIWHRSRGHVALLYTSEWFADYYEWQMLPKVFRCITCEGVP